MGHSGILGFGFLRKERIQVSELHGEVHVTENVSDLLYTI